MVLMDNNGKPFDLTTLKSNVVMWNLNQKQDKQALLNVHGFLTLCKNGLVHCATTLLYHVNVNLIGV